jgi:hypothetical protein
MAACADSRTPDVSRCVPPTYERSERFFGTGVRHVSIKPEDVTLANLICVAIDSGVKSGQDVEILDSADAAEQFFELPVIGDGDHTHRLQARQHRRATFHSGAPDYISIHLFGGMWGEAGLPDDSNYSTRIDLPITRPPRCRYEVAGRCLLKASYPEYPSFDRDAGDGVVTVAGRIARSGALLDVVVLRRDSPIPEFVDRLAETAEANLKTWKFDPAQGEHSIVVTYRYVVDHSLLFDTALDMPSATSLTLRGHPGLTREEMPRLLQAQRH